MIKFLTSFYNSILGYFNKRKFIDWSDRRPIGIVHVADAALPYWEKNPKRWLWDSAIDLTTDIGLQDFAKKMSAFADLNVALCLKAGMQGMVCWEIDACEFPSECYLGAPDYACVLNPELNFGRGGLYGNEGGVVYDFFDKFKKAGLRIGVCIRPCELNLETKKQENSPNPYATLYRKAKFAHAWWGCTLFYIDTNYYEVGGGALLPSSMFKDLHMAFPDSLFIPEAEDDSYYQFSAPFGDIQNGDMGAPASAVKLFPKAFMALNVSGKEDLTPYRDGLIQSVKNGNILMVNTGWESPTYTQTIEIYKAAQS